VPDLASVWYYFRDHSFKDIAHLYSIGNEISEGAAKQTGTSVEHKVLGYAAPNYGNRPIAEAAYANIKLVGMPKWSEDDQAFAKAVQTANKRELKPLSTTIGDLSTPETRKAGGFGASDDIGDIMWTVPTITIRFPANIPNMIAHNKLAAIAMATPIAHKGAVAGAKAVAMTVLDLVTSPALIAKARDFQQNVQFKEDHYAPVIAETDQPAIWLNHDLMERMRPKMEKYYFDSMKYSSYLEQLGIAYPGGVKK
jgi:aminobenzoyl-glutamate utilization protein B